MASLVEDTTVNETKDDPRLASFDRQLPQLPKEAFIFRGGCVVVGIWWYKVTTKELEVA